MSCISIPKINNRIGHVYVNIVTHLKLGNPWLLVVLKSPSLVMRFSSFSLFISPVKKLGRGAMHGSIVPLSLFLFGWMKQQLHLWCRYSCNCSAD